MSTDANPHDDDTEGEWAHEIGEALGFPLDYEGPEEGILWKLEAERIALAREGDVIGAALIAMEELGHFYRRPMGVQEHPTERGTTPHHVRVKRLARVLAIRFHGGEQ